MIHHETAARSVAATRRQPDVRQPEGEPSFCSWQDAKRSDLYALRITERQTNQQIADRYGVSETLVRQQLDRWGIVPEERREARERLAAFRAVSREELRRLSHSDGLTQAQIAARYGVSVDAVADRLAAFSLNLPDPGLAQRGRQGRFLWATVSREELFHLYWEEDQSTREIGRRYRVTRHCVYQRLTAMGIPPHPIGGRGAPVTIRERWHALSDVELARIYHEEDLSPPQIARRFGVSRELVRLRLRGSSIPIKHPDYHRANPDWNRYPRHHQRERHALHLALYRRWKAGYEGSP